MESVRADESRGQEARSARLISAACGFIRIVFPVMALAPVLPFLYMVSDARADGMMLPLWLASWVILLPSAAARAAARRFRSLGAFLGIGAAALAGAYFLATAASRLLPWQEVRAAEALLDAADIRYASFVPEAYFFAVTAESLVIIVTVLLVRLNQSDRNQAKRDRDLQWTPRKYLFDVPSRPLLVWFALLYFFALMFACPVNCGIAAACFIAYGAMYLFYRHATLSEGYLKRLGYLSRMPSRRIRAIGTAAAAAVIASAVVPAALSAYLTAGARPYRDLRDFEGRVGPAVGLVMEEMPVTGGFLPEDLAGFEETGEPWKYAPVLDRALEVLFVLVLLLAAWLSLRSVKDVFVRFRDREDEDGDIAESLPDISEKLVPGRRRAAPDTERERIRREYRRAIRKASKETPGASETPEEIEKNAGLFGRESMRELHDRYEKARYDG